MKKKFLKVLTLTGILCLTPVLLNSCSTEGTTEVDKEGVLISGNKTLKVGETLTLKANFSAGTFDILWTSGDPSVATVDDKGVVSALKVGEATIYVQKDGNPNVRDEVIVKVTEEEKEPNAEFAKATFVDYDGTVLGTDYVKKGEVPHFNGKEPVRLSDDSYSYIFLKWDKDLAAIDEDTTFTAVYETTTLSDFAFSVDLVNGGYKITGYNGTKTDLVIPSTFNFRKVVSIGDGVFSKGYSTNKPNYTIKTVVIPDTVVSIGESAFRYCAAITSVSLPKSVKEIGSYAFENCVSLEGTLEFGDELSVINASAFQYCQKLGKVVCGKGLKEIGRAAFGGCYALQIVFNDGLEKIDHFALEWNLAMKKVTLPDSVKYLGESVFCHCEVLTELNLPKNLETIDYEVSGSYVGYQSLVLGATNLRKITISEENPSFVVVDDDAIYSKDESILYAVACDRHGDFNVSEKCTEIKGSAFYKVNGNGLFIPKKVKKVGQSAFWISKFSSIEFENDDSAEVTPISLGGGAFNECALLNKVVFSNAMTEIPSNAFNGLSNLQEFVSSGTISKVGSYAFSDCYYLKSFNFDGVESIGSFAFEETSIESAKVPAGQTLMEAGMFSGATKLKKVEFLGDKITKYNAFCFQSTAIEKFVMTNKVEKIMGSAFRGCANLKEVSLSSALKGTTTSYIGDYIFAECYNLDTLTFGKALTATELKSWQMKFPANVFKGDSKLATINFRGDEAAFKKVTFADVSITKKITDGTITVNYNYVDSADQVAGAM